MCKTDPLERLIDYAQQHGIDSEPDHEIGDLHELSRAMWALLTTPQKAAIIEYFNKQWGIND